MKIGFSTSHAFDATEAFIAWTAEQLRDVPYDRFEVCHEQIGENGLGAIDDYIRYTVLEKLNPTKLYAPEALDGLRRVFGRLKDAGKEIAFWSHELAAPRVILQHYPELATPRGDLNLSHPLLSEWLKEKYRAFFTAAPEVDVIVLSMTEVTWAVSHRFDNAWSRKDCIQWLIGTINAVCVEQNRSLCVRPFSAIKADYKATLAALDELPNDIEVMVKSDPFDWDPFLPINPAIDTYAPERLIVEFDLGSEYFGRGLLPVVYPDYLRERIDYARERGVKGLTGRLDRRGVSALDREGRLNVTYFSNYAADAAVDTNALLQEQVAQCYQTTDSAALLACFCEAFDVVCKTLYVDGHCLWHGLFGTLDWAQRCVIFEVLCPGQSLAHCADEWHVLADKTSPTIEAVRTEKREAAAKAIALNATIKKLAPNEPGLLARAENLEVIAVLYRDSVIAMQEYLICLHDEDTAPFIRATATLRGTATRADVFPHTSGIPLTTAQVLCFVDDLTEAFDAERVTIAEQQSLALDDNEECIDFVCAGYPGEGHCLSKFTHGSKAIRSEDGRRFRVIKRHVAYTVATRSGTCRLQMQVRGSGKATVSAEGRTLAEQEWNDHDEWQSLGLVFTAPGEKVTVRFTKTSGQAAQIGVLRSITSI